MITYTKAEEKFVSELVDKMALLDYALLSGAMVTTHDVSPPTPGIPRGQITTLCFLSSSAGVYALFDFHTFGQNSMWHKSYLRLRLGANFRPGAHQEFRTKFYSHQEYATRARLLFDCFDVCGDIVSKRIKAIEDGTVLPDRHMYFNSWEFKANLDLQGEGLKDVEFFLEDLAPAFTALSDLTHTFRKIFMRSWSPSALFPGCEEQFWERWRQNTNVSVAEPVMKAMRNT